VRGLLNAGGAGNDAAAAVLWCCGLAVAAYRWASVLFWRLSRH
jgi:hypothetical protein